ncbi:MAG: hypothetical protein HY318_09545 [Armatimonadetes bacterium]|nr:hypothetical protein [Armatimonadota bacterium]
MTTPLVGVLLSSLVCACVAAEAAKLPFGIDWTLGPPFPELKKGGAFGVAGNLLVSAGGMNFPWRETATTFAFDPGVAKWLPLPDLPEGRCYLDGVGVGRDLYAIGGRAGGRTRAEGFRLSRSGDRWKWARIASMNQDRGWSGIAAAGNLIFCVAGNRFGPGEPTCSDKSTVATVEAYRLGKPDKGWLNVATLPGPPRGWIAAACAAGRLFAFGGGYFDLSSGKQETRRSVLAYAFEPRANRWSRIADLPTPLSGADAVAYRNRYIILIGGCSVTSHTVFEPSLGRSVEEYNDIVWVYDIREDRYTPLNDRLPHGVNDVRAAILGDTVYALGGENVDEPTSNTTNYFQIGRIVWETKGRWRRA